MPFYTLAGLSRSPIDAISERGYNSIIYTISATIMLLLLYLGKMLQFDYLYTAIFSFVTSCVFSAVLSMLLIKKFYKSKLWTYELLRDIILGGLLLYMINYFLIGTSDLFQIFIQTTIYILLGLVYLLKVKREWMAELKGLLFAKELQYIYWY